MNAPWPLTLDGVPTSLSQAARTTGLPVSALRNRILREGMTLDEAVAAAAERPLVRRHTVTIDGKAMSLPKAARLTGVLYNTLYRRVVRGVPMHEVTAAPMTCADRAARSHIAKRANAKTA